MYFNQLVSFVYNLYYNKPNISVFRFNSPLLPNVVEQVVKDSNEYLVSKSKPPLSREVVNVIETQVLSIKEPNHKIRMLVGNTIMPKSCFKYLAIY